MSTSVPVGRYMTHAPHVIGAGETIADALRVMIERDVRHLPVMQNGKLTGVVSDRELRAIRNIPGVDPDSTTVEHAMVPGPYHVTPDTPLRRVVAEMARYKIGSVLVMEGEEVLGIFTTTDALRALADLLPNAA